MTACHDAAMRRIAIAGVTGSIGRQALDVIDAHDDLVAIALAAGRDWEGLVEAARRTGAEHLALADAEAAARATDALGHPVAAGADAVVETMTTCGADVVLNAVVGASGLRTSLAALEAGADLALANKESLVAGGALVLDAARRGGGAILPVDSEHSALQQCLEGHDPATIATLVVTASGGPFRGRSRADLVDVRIEDALAHPTWSMGAKITIDSATLMNKGLEVIEAHMLFGVPYSAIEVVVHPQSIVHGMVRFRDGALLAHLGHPDMRVPISYALTFPDRAAVETRALDLSESFALDFEPPDLEAFGCLRLAREAGSVGGTAPAVLNAANEEAVGAFLAGRIGFLDIEACVADALDAIPVERQTDLAGVLAADASARTHVLQRIGDRA